MPRDGSGVYAPPAGTTAIPDTVIESAKHNALVADLTADANAARPVTAGGTGATSKAGARASLEVPGLAGPNIFTGAQRWAKGANIASAATLTLGTDGNFFHVTGTTTITAITGNASPVYLVFDGALTLTHHATALILPGGANITTVAGDGAIFVRESADSWRCLYFQRTSLDASAITSGTFDAARIPDLDANKITAGTLDAARVPNLNASKINAGTLDAARIPDLNASKITAGTLPVARGGTGQTTEAAARGVYTGSSASNTDFPIGTCIIGGGTLNTTNRNATVPPALNSTSSVSFVDTSNANAGAALTGTWRMRGAGLAQRVA